mmetsp:Transcript_32110/g.84165  ORF Transcript_32110/g.84165 Transcript_32110/m.84165 type:complete len:226 (+) Transcript_32110:167-844(+)
MTSVDLCVHPMAVWRAGGGHTGYTLPSPFPPSRSAPAGGGGMETLAADDLVDGKDEDEHAATCASIGGYSGPSPATAAALLAELRRHASAWLTRLAARAIELSRLGSAPPLVSAQLKRSFLFTSQRPEMRELDWVRASTPPSSLATRAMEMARCLPACRAGAILRYRPPSMRDWGVVWKKRSKVQPPRSGSFSCTIHSGMLVRLAHVTCRTSASRPAPMNVSWFR